MTHTNGSRIQMLRQDRGLSQEELAKVSDIERVALSQIENDKRQLKADELSRLADALEVSVDQLLGREPIPEVVLGKRGRASKPKEAVRISVPAKNVGKFKEVLLYILGKVGAKPNVGETVLYKLLYFIDFDYYEKYEEQLIGATYIKNQHGPTPVEFPSIVKEMIASGELELIKSQYFQHTQKKYLPHREPDLSGLSANEIALIDDVLNRLSNMSAKAISDHSHHDVPWVVTQLKGRIDYEAVFYRTPNYSMRAYDTDDPA